MNPDDMSAIMATLLGSYPSDSMVAQAQTLVVDHQDLLYFLVQETSFLSEHPAVAHALAALPSAKHESIASVVARRHSVRSQCRRSVEAAMRSGTLDRHDEGAAEVEYELGRLKRLLCRLATSSPTST